MPSYAERQDKKYITQSPSSQRHTYTETAIETNHVLTENLLYNCQQLNHLQFFGTMKYSMLIRFEHIMRLDCND